jgi:uncharacterized iron-regulated membrane protein
MNNKRLHDLSWRLHRAIGLSIGLALAIIGLSGSVMVFGQEIDNFLVSQQFGVVSPQGERMKIDDFVITVQTAYRDRSNLKLTVLNTPSIPNLPYKALLQSSAKEEIEVLVNPYTRKIIGSRRSDKTLIKQAERLHHELLLGTMGDIITGIIGLFFMLLGMTGVVLWPGWRKLSAGFAIKWQAHPKRLNFDLHKVIGGGSAAFLMMIALIGCCWNFSDATKPAIYAATLDLTPSAFVSTLIAEKSPLTLSEILQKADAALPDGVTTFISIPQKPAEVFRVGKKLPQETMPYGLSYMDLDQYTGNILQLRNGLQPAWGDRLLNTFEPLHSGTFGGLTTRILYVFVGVSPTVLFVTGVVMGVYRRRRMPRVQTVPKESLN